MGESINCFITHLLVASFSQDAKGADGAESQCRGGEDEESVRRNGKRHANSNEQTKAAVTGTSVTAGCIEDDGAER